MLVDLRVVAIADDLTGALEIGAKFAAHGLAATVTTDLALGASAQSSVLVVDTETRHLPAEEAGTRAGQVAGRARDLDVPLVYKKTDSTLRGNIAAEFRAIQELFPQRRIVYAPAYPDMGRTVKDGQLFVHGTLVHKTEFAHDRWSPVRDCRISSVLGDVPALVLHGECDEDVEAAARSILQGPPPRVCAGPAALAEALAAHMQSPARGTSPLPKVVRCLVVNGSLHPVSLKQMSTAAEHNFFDEGWNALEENVEGTGSERALRAGECVRRMLSTNRFDSLVVFGGDTAFGIHRALGSFPFAGIGEAAPGVAISRSGDLLWITKAGGFGTPDILQTIRRRLT